ncbi:MAG TPA: aminopeptidase [Thermomicrobiales bacterium]|nr:aminopeptidase [Thermomicrobiales bacterium]
MIDPRWRELAEILVGYSTATRPGDRVLIAMVEPETFPAALAVYEAALAAGAEPQIHFASVWLQRALLRLGSDELVGRAPELERQALEWADVSIGLRGARNPSEFAGIPPERIAAHRRALGELSASRTERTRWVLVRLPNEAFATAAGMPLDETCEAFWRAVLRRWPEDAVRWRAMATALDGARQVRLTGNGTDLVFSVAGRRWVVGDGRINLPDGELYTAPVEDSAEGVIAFEQPASWAGQTIDGIRLVFRAGEVIEASATRGEALLRQALALDPGARRLGEFGIGVNDGIDRFTGDILFDEKIAGTVHLALGRSYAECGGRNHSALHWDIVKDLRQAGAIEIDGRPIFADGAFLI